MTFDESVTRAYARTINPRYESGELAFFLARRYLGSLVLVLIAVCGLGFLSGCNSEQPGVIAPSVQSASLVATPPVVLPSVVLALPVGTKFFKPGIDADMIYRGVDPGGAVTWDIRVDGSKFHAQTGVADLVAILSDPLWSREDLMTTAVKNVL